MQGTPLLKSVKEFKSLNQINIKRAIGFVFMLCKTQWIVPYLLFYPLFEENWA